MELDDKYRRLKEMVSDLCAIPSANLRLAEVYGAMVKVSVCGGSSSACTGHSENLVMFAIFLVAEPSC